MCAWEVGAWTDAYDGPAFGDPVEGSQRVRQRKRVPEQRQQYSSAECDASRRTGDTGQEGQGFAAGTRQQRVADPD